MHLTRLVCGGLVVGLGLGAYFVWDELKSGPPQSDIHDIASAPYYRSARPWDHRIHDALNPIMTFVTTFEERRGYFPSGATWWNEVDSDFEASRWVQSRMEKALVVKDGCLYDVYGNQIQIVVKYSGRPQSPTRIALISAGQDNHLEYDGVEMKARENSDDVIYEEAVK